MPMASRRNSLARGRAWPVTTPDLRDALGDLLDAVSLVWYDTTNSGDDSVWVSWKSEASRHPRAFAADENSAAIWLTPANADEAETVGDLLRGQVLPQIVEWLTNAFDQDEDWQARDHAKYWTVRGGELTTRTHDQSPRRRRTR